MAITGSTGSGKKTDREGTENMSLWETYLVALRWTAAITLAVLTVFIAITCIMALLGITSVEFCRMGGKGDGPEDPGAE